MQVPLATSQTLAVLSQEAVSRNLPSGDTHIAETPRWCPLKVRTSWHVSVENICTRPSPSSSRPQKTTAAVGEVVTLLALPRPVKVWIAGPPLSASNIFMVPSCEAVKKRLPSPDRAQEYRPLVFLPSNVQTCLKSGMENFLPSPQSSLSSAENKYFPSGEMTTEQTHPLWSKFLMNMPLSICQTLAVSSLTAVIRYCLSCVTAAQLGLPLCPA
mmetsp:Transcript_16355/g.46668  ORF Transcript_16355/g.46668 Transcript_16355/m.46668 type:complete len:214 (-) Transcript_16355:1228-1869(-)